MTGAWLRRLVSPTGGPPMLKWHCALSQSHRKFLGRGWHDESCPSELLFVESCPAIYIKHMQIEWTETEQWQSLPCPVIMETECHHAVRACFPRILCGYCRSLPYVLQWNRGIFSPTVSRLSGISWTVFSTLPRGPGLVQPNSIVSQFSKGKRLPWKCFGKKKCVSF